MYWQPEYELLNREDLKQLQLERLQAVLYRVSRNVPFYRNMFRKHGINPDDLRSLGDISGIPFTTKNDIRDNYPYGLFAVPLREVVRLHASSGTTGKPIVVGYTQNDIRRWGNLTARVLRAGGAGKDDLVQIAFNYGLFTGGLGFHYGAETLGASVIPASSGNAKRQVRVMQDYRTSVLVCTPSYAVHLADTIDDLGINVNSLYLKYGLFGAETWSEGMRRDIQDRLKIVATDNYGISEVMGPGIAGECGERGGLHVNEDHFLAEVIDPKTGENLPAGVIGELVITTLTKEAFPVIRYRTGDLTKIIDEPCSCGRTFTRIGRILGRSDDMLIIKGVNVFPSQIEEILLDIEGARPHYQIIIDREQALDHAVVLVEASTDVYFDEIKKHQALVERIKRRLASELSVSFDVKLVESKTLERSDGKTSRVVDRRRF